MTSNGKCLDAALVVFPSLLFNVGKGRKKKMVNGLNVSENKRGKRKTWKEKVEGKSKGGSISRMKRANSADHK